MNKLSVLFTIVLLSGCSGGFQKSLPAEAAMTDFRSALHIAGETPVSRTIVHVVALGAGDELGLVVHVGRNDGQFPGITRVRAGGTSFAYQRISSRDEAGMTTESGLVSLSLPEMERASQRGMSLELCGVGTCYAAEVPAGLFQQALVE